MCSAHTAVRSWPAWSRSRRWTVAQRPLIALHGDEAAPARFAPLEEHAQALRGPGPTHEEAPGAGAGGAATLG